MTMSRPTGTRLVAEFEREIERLRTVEERVTREIDLPRLVPILRRASILTEADARRVARSHSEARTTYHRASKDLWPMLDREREEGVRWPADADDAAAGQEPAAVAPVGGARGSVG